MGLKITHDGSLPGEVQENCCMCRTPTRYWWGKGERNVALCPDCLHTDPERGQPCPACNGSGKLEIGEEEETAVWEKAVWSAMEESDEEPIGILARYVEQKGLGNV